MPRKTKKQKILAQLHRKLAAVSYPKDNTKILPVNRQKQNASIVNHSTINYYLIPKKDADIKSQNKILSLNYSYVKHDLIKITIFTLIALIFQGVLYFLLNRG